MKWPQSLYWRIALGLVGFLACMLLVQALLFTWVVSRSSRTLPGMLPNRFADAVAADVAGALERDPNVDVAAYVRDQYAQALYPFAIVLRDGRTIMSGGPVPDATLRLARARLRRLEDTSVERQPPGDGLGFRLLRPAAIMVRGEVVGAVVVPPRTPFGLLLRRFAPELSAIAVGVLIVGSVIGSMVIFGPARRRLRSLEDAARRLGSGDLSARAPDRGGDEIASVAHAFNAMADDLAARAEALAESDRVRRQLLADVSHELTTPVTAMRGYLETLAMPELALDAPTRARYLGIISDETARLERIIGDLLDLARLEGGGGGFFPSDVAVSDLFDRVVARHGRAASAAGVTFTTTVTSGAETVVGDRDRLEQALQNLASNAIRYAPSGSAIELAAAPSAEGVAITVTDHGPGIDAEHLPHLFDRFYKADSSRAGTSSGSGLGLSIVKAIVERHGGRITAASRPGRTEFRLDIPSRRT